MAADNTTLSIGNGGASKPSSRYFIAIKLPKE
jgi:hypothetical protein